jgi:hypothetical protein
MVPCRQSGGSTTTDQPAWRGTRKYNTRVPPSFCTYHCRLAGISTPKPAFVMRCGRNSSRSQLQSTSDVSASSTLLPNLPACFREASDLLRPPPMSDPVPDPMPMCSIHLLPSPPNVRCCALQRPWHNLIARHTTLATWRSFRAVT